MTQSNTSINSNNTGLRYAREPEIEFVEPDPITKMISRLKIKGDLSNNLPRSLDDYKVSLQNNPSQLSDEAIKAKSIGSGFFSWATQSKVSVWSTVKVYKSIRFCLLLGAPSHKTRNKTDEQLTDLTGSMHLAKALHALSPSLATVIQRKLDSLDTHESLNTFFKEEHHSLLTFVDVLLPAIYKNLAQNVRECHEKNEGKPVAFVDIISFICETINSHVPHINQRFETIEKTQDEEKKNKIICQVFSHIVDDFLSIVLPNGIDELPLTKIPFLSHHFWQALQKQALPLLFYSLYRQFAVPLSENQKELLLKMQGGESLVSLAQMAGEQAAELLPTIFLDPPVDNHENIPDTPQPSLVEKMSKGFCTLLEGSESLKTWICGWFTKELIAFGESDNEYLKKLWKLFGGYAEPLLIHVFVSMTGVDESQGTNKGRMPDAIGIIMIRLLSLSSRFHNANHKQIEARVEQLKQTGESYKEDEVLLNIFKPFAEDLLCLMGLNDPAKLPLPEFLKGLIIGPIKKLAPAFLLRQYFALLNMDTDDQSTHRKLRALLFDPKNLEDPEIAIKIMAALHRDDASPDVAMSNEFYDKLWLESGTERIAKTLEAMCTALASEVVGSIMLHFGISDQTLLKEENNPAIVKFNRGLISLVEMAFLEILVHAMDTSDEKESKGRHPKSLFAINVMNKIVMLVGSRLEGLKKTLEKSGHRLSQETDFNKREIKKHFIGLAAELHDFIGINPFQHLPLNEFPGGEAIKKGLWSSVKKIFLPHLTHQIYLDTMEWQIKIQNAFDELDKNYHTSHPRWTCKVIAQYSTDYVHHYIRHSYKDAAQLLFNSLKGHFNPFKNVIVEMDGLQTEIEHFIGKNLHKLAEINDPKLHALWPALTHYSEAAMAKFLANFSKTIREIELEHPDLTVDIATQILKDTARHFSIVAQATQKAGVDQSFEVPISEMIAAFGNALHDGVPLQPSDPNEVKDRVRLQGFFIPLTNKLFKLANLSVKDLPLPKILRQQLGELLINKILPLALMNSFKKFLEPQVRNGLMLNLMQMLYAAFNGNELAKRDGGLKEAVGYPDPKQKHLYETCGFVVLELIKLIPDTVVQYVFMKEKVKNMSAQAIGDALMPYLSRWTLLQMLDKIIYIGLPNLHPSKWEGKLGREDLIPLKASVRPDGNMELKRVKDFKFNFPSTEGEINALKEAKAKEAAEVRMELRNAFTKTISQQLHSKAWAFIKSLWSGLQDHLNDLVERMFSDNGLAVKTILDIIFKKIVFDVAGAVIHFLLTPFVSFIKFVTEKTVINRRSEDIIENLQSELLENLVYKWTDTVVESLLRLKKVNLECT